MIATCHGAKGQEKKTEHKIKIGLENNLFFYQLPLQPFMVHIQGSEREKKKYQQDVCMYVDCRCTRKIRQKRGGEQKKSEFIS